MTRVFLKFELVAAKANGAAYAASIEQPLIKAQHNMIECRHDFKTNVTQLLDQLAEVMHPARAARVIAANSRIRPNAFIT